MAPIRRPHPVGGSLRAATRLREHETVIWPCHQHPTPEGVWSSPVGPPIIRPPAPNIGSGVSAIRGRCIPTGSPGDEFDDVHARSTTPVASTTRPAPAGVLFPRC